MDDLQFTIAFLYGFCLFGTVTSVFFFFGYLVGVKSAKIRLEDDKKSFATLEERFQQAVRRNDVEGE